MTPNHIALLTEAVAATRERVTTPQQLFDLVISGPEVPGVPTADTAATVRTLIENAQSEILLVGYAVHNGGPTSRVLAAFRDCSIAVTNARFASLHGLPVAPSPSRRRPLHSATSLASLHF